jgi:hypothetical protein
MNPNQNKNRNKNQNPFNRNGNQSLTDKIKSIAQNTMKGATNLGEKIGQAATDVKQKIQNKVKNTTEKVKYAPTTQDAGKIVGKVQEFMEANSAISKFVAVVLSILVFYILFNLGIHLISQYFIPQTSVKVVDGLIPSNSQIVVSSNPNITSSVPILRSINQDQGLEFTWDVWFFIKDTQKIEGDALIFSKGLAKENSNNQGVCPGVYIRPNTNSEVELNVTMNTMIDPSLNNIGIESIFIKDIPINKWVHCAVRVQNLSVDVYINGVMTQRKNLQTLPNQNYYDTYVGDQLGFDGYISSLNYYAYALNYDQIQNDFVKGPNMKLQGQSNQINYKDYLAMNWYYNPRG